MGTGKKNQSGKKVEDIRKRVTEQTGQLFSEFDEATKTDLLAKLEQASKLEEENRILKETVAQKLIEEEETLQTIEMPIIPDDLLEENKPEVQNLVQDETDEIEELEEIIEESSDSETEEIEETEEISTTQQQPDQEVADTY